MLKSGELDNSQLSSNSSALSDSILFFPLPFLAVIATAELMVEQSSDTLAAGLAAFFALVDLAAGFDVEGFAAGLLSIGIIFSNNSNPDDLMGGSSMSPRISFSFMTSQARVSAEAAMVDWERPPAKSRITCCFQQ